jgi:hypothetical protein
MRPTGGYEDEGADSGNGSGTDATGDSDRPIDRKIDWAQWRPGGLYSCGETCSIDLRTGPTNTRQRQDPGRTSAFVPLVSSIASSIAVTSRRSRLKTGPAQVARSRKVAVSWAGAGLGLERTTAFEPATLTLVTSFFWSTGFGRVAWPVPSTQVPANPLEISSVVEGSTSSGSNRFAGCPSPLRTMPEPTFLSQKHNCHPGERPGRGQ